MKRNTWWMAVVVGTALGSSACGGEDAPAAEQAPTEGGGASWLGPGIADDPLNRFFSLARVHAIAITVDAAGLAALEEEPKVYVEGSVQIDGTGYERVGVRLKGNAGSFVPLGGDYPEISGDGNGNPGKSAFIIDFNRYVKGQDHLGLEKLTINNMVQDDSCIHEYLGYALFRRGGVPASRSGYAEVRLNGELKGLYALIETPDNDAFLKGRFGTDQGNLYEGEYGADLREEAYEHYDQDNGEDTSKQDLAELAALLDAVGEDDDPTDVLEQHFDLEKYVTFAATEIYLGHWDGYARSANNYAIHHSPIDGRWSFLPWGIDQIFIEEDLGRYAGVMTGPGPAWDGGGRVHQLCMASPSCREMLGQAFEDLLARVEQMGLSEMAEKARELVEPLALAESTAHGDPERTIEALDGVTSFVQERGGELEPWLPCLDGGSVDQDGDGYNACTVDCDDENRHVHPGADEICNFADDDCNGALDDADGCPPCQNEAGPDGQYAFCFQPRPWTEAQQICQEQGAELASFHEEQRTMAVMDHAMMAGLGEHVWIGLNDRELEGSFAWTDGSPVDFAPWGPESPKPWGEEEDCVFMAPYGWMDVPCEEPRPFICMSP